MAQNLSTINFKIHMAKQLVESFNEPQETSYYMFASRSLPWTNESLPPEPNDSILDTSNDLYDQMIFGKKITENNIKLMIPRYDWNANTIYAMYDDTDSNLYDKQFFVTVSTNTAYHVFKCLNNNGGAASLYEPKREDTSEDDIFYQTADGYQWKYMYTIDTTSFNSFATNSWIPLIENSNVVSNSVAGAIEVVVIEDSGTLYNSYSNGYFQEILSDVNGDLSYCIIEPTSSANTDFFKNCAIKVVEGPGAGQQRTISEYSVSGGQKTVYLEEPWDPLDPPTAASKYEITPNVIFTGDGVNAQARALVNSTSNTIYTVEITNRGSGYSYATAQVVANTGSLSAETASLRVVISPPGGHGSDAARELGARAVGFSTTFANTEFDTIPASNSFRQFGVIKDPLFANVSLSLTSVNGVFLDSENITISDSSSGGQVIAYNANTSVLRLSGVKGGFGANVTVTGSSSNASATVVNIEINGSDKTFATFDQRYRMGITMNGTPEFNDNDLVTQLYSGANGYVHAANSTFAALVKTRGTFNTSNIDASYALTTNTSSANITSLIPPDIMRSSGELLYIENVQPITRASNLSETIKFIVEF